MWSLYKKKGESDFLNDYSGDKLEPLKFSNGKTQADVVKEVLDSIKEGKKIIFIKGVCGTGKSAIALNLARHFDKTSIVVPIKTLQDQYENDYTKNKYILKKDNSKLKISVIKGRNNFVCPFMKEQADSSFLPCTIEIKEKNMEHLKSYLEQNALSSDLDITEIRRMSIAPSCPYWSPLLPSEVSSKTLEKANKKKYKAVSGKDYTIFTRQRGCGYYDQYSNYIDSDVLIFNSLKYVIETLMGRKPKTELDIIDECDEFLDNFSQEKTINLTRLTSALNSLTSKEKRPKIQSLMYQINEILYSTDMDKIDKISNSAVINLINYILENTDIAEDEEDNYYNRVVEIAYEFENFLDETYYNLKKSRRDKFETETILLDLVTINLQKRFMDIVEKNNVLVLMSGTLHSEQVLKDIFGLSNFKVIDAETIMPGTITKFRTGMEKNCKYENFKNGLVTRKDYLLALNACIEKGKKPILVHVNSFDDLPSEFEKLQYNLNLMTKDKLLELQQDRFNTMVEKFKNKESDILFTTKCSRGIDFPGDQCNSIVITKYPYPDIKSLFWQILKKERPDKFMEFYLDKARRELLQKIYRGVRYSTDHVLLLSPDSRVLDVQLR